MNSLHHRLIRLLNEILAYPYDWYTPPAAPTDKSAQLQDILKRLESGELQLVKRGSVRLTESVIEILRKDNAGTGLMTYYDRDGDLVVQTRELERILREGK
jgi:hypothetical protein